VGRGATFKETVLEKGKLSFIQGRQEKKRKWWKEDLLENPDQLDLDRDG